MLLTTVFITITLQTSFVKGIDLNSLFGREVCFDNQQENCNEEFVDKYPDLSRSSTNLTVADSYMLLYTRKNPEKPELLHKCGGELPPNSNFDPKKKLVIFFVPFGFSYCNTAVYREWTIQFLKREDLNLIAFDYGWGNFIDYATSVFNLKIASAQAIILLRNIQEQTGIPYSNITCIGFSLGAQVCGMVGSQFHFSRIIGLDPAGLAFDKDKTPPEERLDQSDADLVEVWHCCAGPCLTKFGIDYDAGHVNFYINGGSNQIPICYEYAVKTFLRGDFLYGVATFLTPDVCNHIQCLEYFKVTINPGDCQFVGVKCKDFADFEAGKCQSCGPTGENCLIMGYDTNKYIKKIPTTPEKYYVKTFIGCPYCDTNYVNLEGYLETYKSSLQTPRVGG